MELAWSYGCPASDIKCQPARTMTSAMKLLKSKELNELERGRCTGGVRGDEVSAPTGSGSHMYACWRAAAHGVRGTRALLDHLRRQPQRLTLLQLQEPVALHMAGNGMGLRPQPSTMFFPLQITTEPSTNVGALLHINDMPMVPSCKTRCPPT